MSDFADANLHGMGSFLRPFASKAKDLLAKSEKEEGSTKQKDIEAVAKVVQESELAVSLKELSILEADKREREALLLAILKEKENLSNRNEAVLVFNRPEFKNLNAVKIVKNHVSGDSLVNQVARAMDLEDSKDTQRLVSIHRLMPSHKPSNHSTKDTHTHAAPHQSSDPALTKIVSGLEGRVKTIKDRRLEVEKLMKKSEKQMQEMKKVAATKKLKEKVEFLRSSRMRNFKKVLASMDEEAGLLGEAAQAIREKDVNKVMKVQKMIKDLLKAKQEASGDFLHLFLQLEVTKSGMELMESGASCPFCGAECIQQCHDGGATYTQCLTTCAH